MGGIASLQLGLPLVWTEARRRGVALERVVGWMSTRPAGIAGLHERGRIEIGADADFAVFAVREDFVVDAAALKHKNPVCPYAGTTLTGVIRRTYLRGVAVNDDAPNGQLLRRSPD